jgi:peroxiredoxin
MKKIVLVLMIISVSIFNTIAQTKPGDNAGYEISGNIEGLHVPYIYISGFTYDMNRIMDSAKVINGKFQFTGKVSYPSLVELFLKDHLKSFAFYLENSKIKIDGNMDNFDEIDVSGSETQCEYLDLQKNKKEILEKIKNIQNNFTSDGASNPDTLARLREEIMNLFFKGNKITLNYISQHPRSKMAANEMSSLVCIEAYDDLISAYNNFDISIKNSDIGIKMAEQLEILRKSSVGQRAPDFTQNDINGNPVTLSSFKGNYILLDFWASWCGPCRAENPNVLIAYNKFKNKNFKIISISIDNSEKAWKKAVTDDGMPWIHLSDLKGRNNEVAKSYGIQAVPTTLLIDPEGMIIARNIKGEALQKKLAELFK